MWEYERGRYARVQEMVSPGLEIGAVLRSRSVRLFGVLAVSVALSCSGVARAGVAGCAGGGSSGVTPYLFDCRAYELVSPVYKEGFQVQARAISEDGSRVLALSFGILAQSPEGDLQYEFLRRSAGWEASAGPVGVPYSELPLYTVEGISPDFQSTLVFAATPGQSLVEEEEVYLHLPGGSPVRVGPLEPPVRRGLGLYLAGASADLRRSVYNMVSDFAWPGDGTSGLGRPTLYEYDYQGEPLREPRLVGVDNEGVPASVAAGHLISDCGTYLGQGPQLEGDVYNAVSASGGEVFFTAVGCGAPNQPPVDEVYVRLRETPAYPAHAVAVSEPPLLVPGRVCTGECEKAENEPSRRQAGVFAGASSDGSRVFFLTGQSLVNGDEGGNGTGQDLYEADISEGAVTRLVQVSRGGVGNPTPGSKAKVLGVVRVSEDGSHVYFVAGGALTGPNREGEKPVAGAPNLYVVGRECPGGGGAPCVNPVEHTSFIATLSSPGDAADWAGMDRRPAQATPDGRFLVFPSMATLTLEQREWTKRTGQMESGQVFEYDAETETLVRVSRGEGGYNEDGDSSVYGATIPIQNYAREIRVGSGRYTRLTVSADGSRVFFQTSDALTPQALNGVVNVYEYHAGHVGLISDGHDMVVTAGGGGAGSPAVELVGTDESGRDVFFTTADRLVPQDTDDQVDLYDARVEGGFAPLEAAPCAGDSCQAPVSVPPSLPVAGVPSPAEEAPVSGSTGKKVSSSSKKKPGKRGRRVKRRGGRAHRRSRGLHRAGKTVIGRGR